MKLKRIYFLFFIVIILSSISLADIEKDDFKEEIKYEETWDEPIVLSDILYPNIMYLEVDDEYIYYDLNGVSQHKKSKIVRVKKSSISYKYDYIYDIDDGKHTINNPLNKEIKNEEFFLDGNSYYSFVNLPSYIFKLEDRKDEYELNDYYYITKSEQVDGRTLYKVYKVYKDLIKINSIPGKTKGPFFIDFSSYYSTLNIRLPVSLFGDKMYYTNVFTDEIIELEKEVIIIDRDFLGFINNCIIVLVPLIIGFIIFIKIIKNDKRRASSIAKGPTLKLEQRDPNFNRYDFLEWVKKVFIEIHKAWTDKDYQRIMGLQDNALYATYKTKFERDIDMKVTNHFNELTVKDMLINDYYLEDGFEFIKLTLVAYMIKYTTNDETNEVMNRDIKVIKHYNIICKRKEGVLTPVGEMHEVSCPNCGAPVNISASAICEHCNSVLNTGEHGWVMSNCDEIHR